MLEKIRAAIAEEFDFHDQLTGFAASLVGCRSCSVSFCFSSVLLSGINDAMIEQFSALLPYLAGAPDSWPLSDSLSNVLNGGLKEYEGKKSERHYWLTKIILQ